MKVCIFSTSCFNKPIKKYNANFAVAIKKQKYVKKNNDGKTFCISSLFRELRVKFQL